MGFEQEVFYLLLVGFAVVTAAYAVQVFLLGGWNTPAARRPFLGQLAWQTAAFVLLLSLLFPYRFGMAAGESVYNTAAVCFCGLCWAVSLLCALHGFRALLGRTEG